MNLLEIRGLGRLLLSPWTFRLLRTAFLVLLLAMAAFGWHHHGIPGVAVKDPLMYTNLATHLFWGWWMMGIVFLALLFGRGWCAVCPVGWVNDLFTRIGLRRPLPSWLRGFVPVTLTLVALQVAVYLLAIHRYPDHTALLLALMLLLAAGAGLLWRGRAFCSLLCPAGAVLGLYARVAPLELRVKDAEICAACTGKECISGGKRWTRLALGGAVLFWHGQRPECPAGLVPAQIRDSASCSLCLNCARNCGNGNISLKRRPWLADLGKGPLAPGETFFFLVLLGMITANFSKVYVDLREALFWAPQSVALLLGWEGTGYYVLAALWVSLVVPFLLLLPGFLALRLGDLRVCLSGAPEAPSSVDIPSRPGFWETAGALALPFIPLVLAAHLALAVVKLNAKGGYLPFVLGDPAGVKSYLALNVVNTMSPPGVLISLDILKWIVLALVLGGWTLSLAAARRASSGLSPRFSPRFYVVASALGVTSTAALYLATVVRWLFIR